MRGLVSKFQPNDGRDSTRGEIPRSPRPVTELDYEYVDSRNLDARFLVNALAPLQELPLTGNIRVVVTSRMDASLAARVEDCYSGPFQQSRIMGRVTAKTVTDQSSSTEILVDAAALQPEARLHVDGSLERVLGHEGRHLVLREKGEDAHSCIRALCPADAVEEALGWMGALAVEEYRIEAALCERGEYGISYDEQLPPALEEWHQALAVAGEKWGSGQGSAVLELTNEIITRSAYVAAAHRFGRPLAEATTNGEHWASLIGETWLVLLRLTEEIPSADVRVEQKVLVPIVRDVAALAQVWCKRIGFEIASDGEGLFLWPLNVAAADRPAA